MAYCNAIRDLSIIIPRNFRRIYHILPDELHCCITDCGRTVEEVAFDGSANIRLAAD
jgi:hypothetical protein